MIFVVVILYFFIVIFVKVFVSVVVSIEYIVILVIIYIIENNLLFIDFGVLLLYLDCVIY